MDDERRFSWSWAASPVHRHPGDPFFLDADAPCWRDRKQFVAVTLLEEEEAWDEEDEDGPKKYFPCHTADCRSVFSTISQYELHYNSVHRHRCHDCRHAFPTDHLLQIHITEWHDPLFELSHETNKYSCLLDICPEKFSSHERRKDHLITAHKFPANFRFTKPTKNKSPRSKSDPKKKKRNPETPASDSMETDVSTDLSTDVSTDGHRKPLSLADLARGRLKQEPHATPPRPTLTNSDQGLQGGVTMATRGVNRLDTEGRDDVMETSESAEENPARRFVYKANIPKTICFGAGSQRGFQHSRRGRGRRGGGGKTTHWHQRGTEDKDTTVDIQEVDMEELSAALHS